MSIKTWEQWQENEPLLSTPYAMQAEIDELRAALQERDAEIERLAGSELGLNRYLATVQTELASIKGQEPAYLMQSDGRCITPGHATLGAGHAAGTLIPLFLAAGAQPVPAGYALIPIAMLRTWGVYEDVIEQCQYPTTAPVQAGAEPAQDGFALLPKSVIEMTLNCLNTPERADLRLVLRDLHKALRAAPVQAGAQPTIRDFRTVQDHIKTVDIVGWRWVATCGSGSYQLTDYEPMRGYSYKSPVYEVPPVQAQERKPLTDEVVRLSNVALREMPMPSTDWHEAAKRVCQFVSAHGIKEKS